MRKKLVPRKIRRTERKDQDLNKYLKGGQNGGQLKNN